ncbi:MAG: hypothetical protein H0U42_03575 [Thermoleophilaceae bacterium]|nr:hypothetical protein [Thermoleophilaceae bacterium]
MTKTIRTTLALAVALSLMAVGLPGAAVATKSAEVKVTLVSNGGDFSGKVKSKRGKCKADREVKVYIQGGNSPDRSSDELYNSDTSEDNGDWSLGNNRAGEGTYYAYVGRKSGCKRAISESVDVPRDPFDEEDV